MLMDQKAGHLFPDLFGRMTLPGTKFDVQRIRQSVGHLVSAFLK